MMRRTLLWSPLLLGARKLWGALTGATPLSPEDNNGISPCVSIDWMRWNEVDNIGETILLSDLLALRRGPR